MRASHLFERWYNHVPSEISAWTSNSYRYRQEAHKRLVRSGLLLYPFRTHADLLARSTVFGESFDKLGAHVPAKPEDYEFTKEFWRITEGLLATEQIKPHPVTLGKEGLLGVFEGMQKAREGRVSGEKLVYRVDETPRLSK